MIDENRLLECLGACLEEYAGLLEPREEALCQRVFAPPLQRYVDRLKALRFTGLERVLDACSGFGQWSVALSLLNQLVDACDISPPRVDILRKLASLADIGNINAVTGSLGALPYEDDSFDAAFCYVSLNCTAWKESLRELYRVLKPGGQVYLTSNGFGYHVRMWVEEPHKTAHRSPRFFTALSLQNTLEYEEHGTPPELGQIIVEKDEMREFLRETGFTIVSLEAEGHIDMSNGEHPPTPFFPGEYRGLTCCYEVLAAK